MCIITDAYRYKVLAILCDGFDAAVAEPRLYSAAENELGLRQFLESQGHEYIVFSAKDGAEDGFGKLIGDTDVLITIPFYSTVLTREFFEKAKNLKICIVAGVGFDHIDLNAALVHSVQVLEVSGASVVSIAEQVVMSILLLVRNFTTAHEMVEGGEWQLSHIARNAFDLENKVVGIIGTGRIGYSILERLVPFDCQLLYWDDNPLKLEEQEQAVNVRRIRDLKEFVSLCDVIVVSIPLHEGTISLVNRELLSHFRKGTWLVNCARGAICNMDDVAAALRSGHLRGYAGDSWNIHPAPKDHPWRSMKNPLHGGNCMTPHYSALTLDAQARYARGVKTILERFFAGEDQDPDDVVVGVGQSLRKVCGQ
ncbi:NAD-dependent formate dehydrogenase [Dentipellis sp. KUC8613]|nr:NAD-dependent formate dehydrogenase [Dentipellis sp. KUC8613]